MKEETFFKQDQIWPRKNLAENQESLLLKDVSAQEHKRLMTGKLGAMK